MKIPLSYVWAILASLTWGMTYALDQKILTSISPLYLAIINAIVTLVIAVPLAIFVKNDLSIKEVIHGEQFWLIIVSSILVSLAGIFILYGIKNLGASAASIIEISYPVFVILFTALLWQERLKPSFFVGALLILCGVVIVIRGRA